jgi:CIC family chloride channel protein
MESEQSDNTFLKRRNLAAKGAIVGIFSGTVAVGFRILLEKAELLRNLLLSIYSDSWQFIPAGIFILTILFTIQITRKIAPDASGSGIPHLKGVLKKDYDFKDVRVLLTKFFGGIIGIGSGLALGREGPTVQMGGALGSILSRVFSSNPEERKLLICAGAGSGLAAAFNAPFAGLLFILEELQQRFDRHSMVVAFCATISANLVCRAALGQSPIFKLRLLGYPSLDLIMWCLVFGIVTGFIGLLFNLSLLRSIKLFSDHKLFLGISLGLLSGFIGFYYPDLLGIGHHLTEKTMHGMFSVQLLMLFFIARFCLTILSYNTGSPGGIFAPLLLLGAVLGAIFHHGVELFEPGKFHLEIFLVLGMGGLFSAVVRSPITGVVLILEMTNEFYLFLPLMVISITAYAIPEFYANKPIYDALLELDAEKRRQKEMPAAGAISESIT